VENVKQPWKLNALCRDMDTDIFFPSPGPTMHQQIAEAKAICAQCPVRTDCLDYAVGFIVGNFITLPGIYGGTTEMERRRLWRLTRQTTGETDGPE
jgi:WhiB family redox-sensing transcriptional regulator